MTGTHMDDSSLEGIVNNLLEQEPDWGLPINLERVAQLCWVSKIDWRPLENPGMVVSNHGYYTIILNSRERLRSRQRFTLAHEIAHILLAEGDSEGIKEYRDDSTNMREQANPHLERLCDRLAAQLLMPTSIFLRFAAPWTITSIPRLARLFDTSMTATAIRYTGLMPRPCIVVLWRPSRKTGGRLLPAWHVQNELCGNSRFHGPTSKRLTKHSVIYEAFLGTESFKGTMLVPLITKSGALYERMEVEALGYGTGDKRSVVSLIYPTAV